MSDETGFVRLSRKYFRSDLWKEHREFSRAEAWLDMIATATFAPETRLIEGRCVNLQRGELSASVRYLASRWSWSKSKVERFLSALVDAQRIRDRYETGTRLISLCNYEAFNPVRDSDESDTGPPAGQWRDKVKEGRDGKEERRDLNTNTPAAPRLEEVLTKAEFVGIPKEEAERFWHHFESMGWVDRNGNRIHNWQAKLVVWGNDARAGKLEKATKSAGQNGVSESAKAVLAEKELARIEKKIEAIRNSYDSHQSHTIGDVAQLEILNKRRRELKAQLGFVA